MDKPGYWFTNSKGGMEALARYVTADEWKEVATEANKANNRHHATTNPLVMGLLMATLGVCFCPLLFYGCFVDMEGKTNADIDMLPITQKLKKRGITLHFSPMKNKFDLGGMSCMISAHTPLL